MSTKPGIWIRRIPALIAMALLDLRYALRMLLRPASTSLSTESLSTLFATCSRVREENVCELSFAITALVLDGISTTLLIWGQTLVIELTRSTSIDF